MDFKKTEKKWQDRWEKNKVFEAKEDWQANKKYNNYPEYSEFTRPIEIAEKVFMDTNKTINQLFEEYNDNKKVK